MIDTKELEGKIVACLLLKPELLNEIELEEKYFVFEKLIIQIKNLYKKYKYLDLDLVCRTREGYSEKILNFIVDAMADEFQYKNIYGYYKRLKSVYKENQITKLANEYKNKKITYKDFIIKMRMLDKEEDFEEEELLTIENIKEYESVEREYTQINELDYLLKGIEYGKLSLWSGITNHGKTTLMIQFAKECIKKHKKIFYFSGEQTAQEFKNYLYVGMCKKEQLEFITDKNNSKIYDTKPKQQVIEYFDNIYKNCIYVYNNNIPNNNIQTMLKVMNKAYLMGVRIFFIDNFMQLDNSERLEEQTRIVESFKRFARDNNCIVNLVAHPRKTQFQKNRLTIFDISGTQNIANKSSNICTILRVDLLPDAEYEEIKRILAKYDYDIRDCDAIVEVLKTKGNACKMVGLSYDKETKTYKEVVKTKVEIVETKKRRGSNGDI